MEDNMTKALLGSVMRLPIALMAFGIHMLARAMPGMPGMPGMPSEHGSTTFPPHTGNDYRPLETRSAGVETPVSLSYAAQCSQPANIKKHEQESAMPDTDLADDQAKWVRFSVWYMKRGHEKILHSGEELLTKNFGPDRFKVSRIYSFIRDVEDLPVPERRKKYEVICEPDGSLKRGVADLLDVRFEVIDRTNREDLHKDQEQLDRLAGIEMALQRISSKIMPDVE